MPAMRRWREYGTAVVHGFSPIKFGNDPLKMFCGAPMMLRSPWSPSGFVHYTEVPTRRNLTHELPSVKTPLTCMGCIANGK